MKPKKIKTERDYNKAIKQIELLMSKESLGKKEANALELLGKLASVYEDKKYPISPPSSAEALRFRKE